MKFLIFAFLTLTATITFAEFNDSFIDANIGYPLNVAIENPDESKAYYDGITFRTAFNYNFSENRSETAYGFSVHYKYLKLDNTKTGSITESAVHKGVGAGVFVKSAGLYLGVNYSLIKASHQSSGAVSALDEFEYMPVSVDFSYTIPYGNMVEIGPAFSYTFTDFKKTETGLSKDSPYAEQIIWLKILFYIK